MHIELGLRAEDVAQLLAMSVENYRLYERGLNKLPATEVTAFAAALGVEPDHLLDRLGLVDRGERERGESVRSDGRRELDQLIADHPDMRISLLTLLDFDNGDLRLVREVIESIDRRRGDRRR